MGVVVSTKSELVVPRSVRRRAGLKNGQKVEFKVSGGVIHIVPKLPVADDEYTPAQRRLIDARLRKARKGPYCGPYDSVDEMLASMKGKKLRAKRTKRGT
jgi:bifunctional DNA-binding transcriptional regulator/antitoxin component of YhaV-PrlF toxin-antitoxin module